MILLSGLSGWKWWIKTCVESCCRLPARPKRRMPIKKTFTGAREGLASRLDDLGSQRAVDRRNDATKQGATPLRLLVWHHDP